MLRFVFLFALVGAGCQPGPNYVGTDPDGRPADDAAPVDGAVPDAPPAGPEFLSCEGLPTTCGPNGDADCCASTEVQGGTYYRSYDVATDANNSMDYPATVSGFRLDVYEVTVGRFRKFIQSGQGTQVNPPAAGAGAHPNLSGSGWQSAWDTSLATTSAALPSLVKCNATNQTWTDTSGDNETMPMNCITWWEAFAFCIWDGGYLPTEAEWNYAATGGTEQRAFPWSTPATSRTIDCTYANYLPSTTECVGGANPVGSESPNGDGRWGQTDLAGNVFEWALDYYSATYPQPCIDCANLTESDFRVIRGGTYNNDAVLLRAGHRASYRPTMRSAGQGWRCARRL